MVGSHHLLQMANHISGTYSVVVTFYYSWLYATAHCLDVPKHHFCESCTSFCYSLALLMANRIHCFFGHTFLHFPDVIDFYIIYHHRSPSVIIFSAPIHLLISSFNTVFILNNFVLLLK
jgi:hypothetical protein